MHRITLAATLTAGLLSPIAMQASAGADEPPQPPNPASAAGIQAENTASAKAAATGEPVEVMAHRSETSRVLANPSGSLTEERYVLPQWVRQQGTLVDIDTSLSLNKSGTVSTKATSVGLEFSNGGQGPMATIIRDGRSMSLSWPAPLPTPEISENTATYAEVLPGVDLKLRAGASGFAQLLVVKTPEAAANPALKTIKYKMAADGVTVEADAHGNLSAINPAGQHVFTAPTPRMWDSSSTPQAQPAARSAATADAGPPPPPGDEFEPGHGAQETAMPLKVGDGQLALTPDPQLLTGPDTQYPVYIDPYIDGTLNSWTIAYKAYPNGAFYNGAGWINSDGSKGTSVARAGYENYTNGLARSFFALNTKNLWSTNKQVIKSTFRIKNTWSWSCTSKPVELWHTGALSRSTTWHNQPRWDSKLDTVNDSKGWSSGCPGGNLAFDITPAAKQAASSEWDVLTMGLRATSESDVYGWKKFSASSAKMSTEYNTPPSTPTSLDTIPSTKNSAGCGSVAPYGLIGNTDISLTAKLSDRDGGTVKAQFNLWATGHHPADDPKGVMIVNQSVSVTSGTVAKLKVPKATLSKHLATAGGNFSWKVQAEDGRSSSAWTPAAGKPGCRFVYDPTRPSNPPEVTSKEFPDGGDGWPNPTGKARTQGTFTLSNGGIKDVAKYEYWTDWDPTVRTATPTALGGSAPVKLTPVAAGSHGLYVRSVDRANNRSDRALYLFYANSPGIKDEPGDLNGDKLTDFYGVRTDGALWLYPGQGNGRPAPYNEGSSTNFDGASITHRGDWTDDGYEDLIAAMPGANDTKSLYLYPNNGVGYACTASDEEADGASKACIYGKQELKVYNPENKHWAKADQILAVGDVDGPLDTDGDGTTDVEGHPDLLVKQGDQLWLYYGSSSWYLDENIDTPPVLIGDGNWADYTITAPNDVNKDAHVDMIARKKSTGELFLYPGTGPRGEGFGNASARKLIGESGWTTTNRPLITSGGDGNGDGRPDLWATSPEPDKQLLFYPTLTTTGHGTPTDVGANGWLNFQALS